MGIIPLEYLPGDTAESLGLTGRERYTVVIPSKLTPRMTVDIQVVLHSVYSVLSFEIFLFYKFTNCDFWPEKIKITFT